ncbi:Uncharacterised protein [Streptococcus agalactiae]|uniref:Uncharacterized protein n=1 Tax=Streptococcus agalactiae TaxID=1311 RepID=A0A8B4RF46_STRAG|nr:Uncharacterised protein [Streptococcus agalactiae]SUN14215.1 Uncharacterised protein [Streptococcus agalactiae]SUN23559.1 Uncharacterised protein [Streptococcus agalactiae]SUN27306.1 Uncharacterised protein [Streptococcus agalactiae]
MTITITVIYNSTFQNRFFLPTYLVNNEYQKKVELNLLSFLHL